MNFTTVPAILAAILLPISPGLHAEEVNPSPAFPNGFIGFMLGRDDFRQIGAVLDKSPAGRAGIQAGDYLLSVDGRPTNKITTANELLGMLQGPAGFAVQLTLRKAQTGETVTLKLLRDPAPPRHP